MNCVICVLGEYHIKKMIEEFFFKVLQCVKREKNKQNNFLGIYFVLLEIEYIYIYLYIFGGFPVAEMRKKNE